MISLLEFPLSFWGSRDTGVAPTNNQSLDLWLEKLPMMLSDALYFQAATPIDDSEN
jgi:hypothetical protein